ncbi:MAG: ABC transporter ATP-binding protein [Bacteroidia bacterium]
MRVLLRGLYPYYRRYPWLLIFGVTSLVASNVVALYPAVGVGKMIDIAVSVQSEKLFLLAKIALSILGATLLRGLLMVLMRQTLVTLSRRIERDYRADLYHKILRWDAYNQNTWSSGEVLARLSEDMAALRNFTGPAVLYGLNALTLIVIVGTAMFWTHPILAAITLVPLFLLVPTTVRLRRLISQKNQVSQNQLSKLSEFVQQVYAHLRSLRGMGAVKPLKKRFDALAGQLYDSSYQVVRVEAYLTPLTALWVSLSFSAVVVGGGALHDKIPYGVIGQFAMYVNLIVWPLSSLGWLMSLTQKAIVSFHRLEALATTRPHMVFPAQSLAFPTRASYKVVGMHFSYPGSQEAVFENFHMEVAPGEWIWITGPLGSGKTTLLRLLARIYEPTAGTIFLGEYPLSSYAARDLYHMVGYAPQEAFIFGGTIEENLRWGKPDATESEMWHVLEIVQWAEEVARFPHQLKTPVGEWGLTLSGGQKQRLSLARILLRQPKILLLDDVWAPLDSSTLDHLMKALQRSFPQATVLFISHRWEVAPYADRKLELASANAPSTTF